MEVILSLEDIGRITRGYVEKTLSVSGSQVSATKAEPMIDGDDRFCGYRITFYPRPEHVPTPPPKMVIPDTIEIVAEEDNPPSV
jgi:hypothetical protein